MDTVSVMLCCLGCRRQSRRTSVLHAHFDGIDAVYPGTVFVCLIDSRDEIVAQKASIDSTSVHLLRPDELPNVISTLRRSVALFAGTLLQYDTTVQPRPNHVVHIKGERHLFSSYGLPDHHVLAFYTVMSSDALASWDCAAADVRLESILLDLSRLLSPT
ncbi:hypothetical protein H257_18035 [Aphanomyces astaci]|uniref:CCZ1/INTU/HSP4 first Longin domain-containing protein n=1 Tax=Aphanomyces astaci TaxID=112090 RepID=W4FCF2_APHAT|nr:hypothetical protein H257_18035 [Aphanomyces astaci]ETV65172.1 hypothetical protein H257_18035 [Aphanomyces astaci]|eukprot:XP_009845346.1 hypothetical protein H257_18035 [Aphanomyces astaci]